MPTRPIFWPNKTSCSAPLSVLTCTRQADNLPEIVDPAPSDRPANAVIWEGADGEVAGYAVVSRYNNPHFRFRPGSLTEETKRETMEWAVDHLRLGASEKADAGPVALDAAAYDHDMEGVALLERHGFVATEIETLHMARPICEPVPWPEFPPGFVPWPLAGEAEVSAYVAAHRASYGTQQMTLEERLGMTNAPYFLAELDLLAVSPTGSMAAFCVCTKREDSIPPCTV